MQRTQETERICKEDVLMPIKHKSAQLEIGNQYLESFGHKDEDSIPQKGLP